jgi:hypothetical protein
MLLRLNIAPLFGLAVLEPKDGSGRVRRVALNKGHFGDLAGRVDLDLHRVMRVAQGSAVEALLNASVCLFFPDF